MTAIFARKAFPLVAGVLATLLLFSLLLNLLLQPSTKANIETSEPIKLTALSQQQAFETVIDQATSATAQPSAPPAPALPDIPALTLPPTPAETIAAPATDTLLASLPGLPALTAPTNNAPVPDSDIIPIFSVPPEYPRHAQRRGIEGWVQIRFTITATGKVKDMQIVEANPKGYFEQAALDALKHYRFRPKEVNGKKVARIAEQRMVFQP